ncbi:MAG: histidine phosphatase family protein [Clostridia bacterium]|nr:histidine phosphatase family protein [Clostridia bacterium]
MTRLILIRHGQSEANLHVWFAGHTDAPLTERGHAQARAAADYLLTHEHIDAVYASSLTRAMDTARPTADAFGLPVIPEQDLREIFAGEWEGVPFAVLNEKYPEDRLMWSHDLSHALCTGGETVAQVFERVVATVTRIAEENEGKTVLIATHWTPVMSMLCKATVGELARIGECPEPANASIQILRFEKGRFTPEQINITAHLVGIEGGTHI